MCPFCKDPQKPCRVIEQPDGKLMCECGKHSWPNAAVYAESLRTCSLTVVKAVHNWTQSY
ncbi:MAG: hypothetical protein ABIU54_07455 [Candidatus Eisenbacteria bacterium]